MRRGQLLLTLATLWALPSAGSAQPTGSLADGGSLPLAQEEQRPAHRRDPFRPFTLDIRPGDAHVQLTPLQRYELGQLTVVGTVWAVNPPRAMVEDSAGMGFIVTIGTPIGRHGGVVSAIEPERVIVEERILDFFGKEQTSRVVMETPKDDPNQQPARGERK